MDLHTLGPTLSEVVGLLTLLFVLRSLIEGFLDGHRRFPPQSHRRVRRTYPRSFWGVYGDLSNVGPVAEYQLPNHHRAQVLRQANTGQPASTRALPGSLPVRLWFGLAHAPSVDLGKKILRRVTLGLADASGDAASDRLCADGLVVLFGHRPC